MMTITPEKLSANVTAGLDRLEEALPTIPARVLRLQRTATSAYYDRTTQFWTTVADQTKGLLKVARTSTNTVTGQARSAASDVAKTAQTGTATVVGQARAAATDVAKTTRTSAKRVSGQASAQTRKVAKRAEQGTTKVIDQAMDNFEDTIDEAAAAVDAVTPTPGSGKPYEQWTKAELLERAKDLDVDGRTMMSKKQLISALRK